MRQEEDFENSHMFRDASMYHAGRAQRNHYFRTVQIIKIFLSPLQTIGVRGYDCDNSSGTGYVFRNYDSNERAKAVADLYDSERRRILRLHRDNQTGQLLSLSLAPPS